MISLYLLASVLASSIGSVLLSHHVYILNGLSILSFVIAIAMATFIPLDLGRNTTTRYTSLSGSASTHIISSSEGGDDDALTDSSIDPSKEATSAGKVDTSHYFGALPLLNANHQLQHPRPAFDPKLSDPLLPHLPCHPLHTQSHLHSPGHVRPQKLRRPLRDPPAAIHFPIPTGQRYSRRPKALVPANRSSSSYPLHALATWNLVLSSPNRRISFIITTSLVAGNDRYGRLRSASPV